MLEKFRLNPGETSGEQTSDAVVVDQAPRPGTTVDEGSHVNFTLVRPEVTLAAGENTPVANDEVGFTLRLEPLPLRAAARRAMAAHGRPPVYHFYWNDASSPEASSATNVTHAFPQPGEYNVYAEAEVAGKKFKSNTVKLVAGFQAVLLRPRSERLQVGTPDEFIAEATPPAKPDSAIEYCFKWGDGTPDTCGASVSSTHAYQGPGQFAPAVVATVNKSATRASGPVEIEVASVAPPELPASRYQVTLGGATPMEPHKGRTFAAALKPDPPANSRVEYCFRWEDGTPESCQPEANATHAYATQGKYRPYVVVFVDGEQSALSAPLDIAVVGGGGGAGGAAGGAGAGGGGGGLSWLDILLRVLLVLGAFAAAYGARRITKMMKVRVTPHGGTPESTIAGAASISKGPLVRIRCVTTDADVTLTSPGPVVPRKRKEPYVA